LNFSRVLGPIQIVGHPLLKFVQFAQLHNTFPWEPR
jgi:hypothetical protein